MRRVIVIGLLAVGCGPSAKSQTTSDGTGSSSSTTTTSGSMSTSGETQASDGSTGGSTGSTGGSGSVYDPDEFPAEYCMFGDAYYGWYQVPDEVEGVRPWATTIAPLLDPNVIEATCVAPAPEECVECLRNCAGESALALQCSGFPCVDVLYSNRHRDYADGLPVDSKCADLLLCSISYRRECDSVCIPEGPPPEIYPSLGLHDCQ